eukprot:CAMPEP_0118923662 /NCGR_PEP_ID=MMETSP1169-20130426/2102_1 /TAXON_ID=36882 /ORGANISM="Pyramimonas obovata, Strain CCMP722" /LENGTH=671 /DNA_ID=CAMNT_0006864679 /DNA_START=317 /DNA_END=2332 /DNA_ORIENTATION=-
MDLKQKIAGLKQRIKLLEGAKDVKNVTKCGYLYKYRPFGGGYFSPNWSLRFFSLIGKSLLYYKSEQDTNLHPRARFELNDSFTIEIEGLKRGRYWTFSLIDTTGGSLLRLSTENKKDGEMWIAALKAAGNIDVEVLPPDSRWKSPRPPSIRGLQYRAGGGGSSAGSSQASASLHRKGSASETASESDMSEAEGTRAKERVKVRRKEGAEAKEAAARAADRPRTQMRVSFPIHKSRYSILSSERMTNQNHHGLLNLAAIILVVTNGRLIMENLLKYGFNVGNMGFWLAHPMRAVPLVYAWLALSLFGMAALLTERFAANGTLREREALIIHILNISTCMLGPCFIVINHRPDILVSIIFMLVVLTLCMKLISYAHVNYDLRGLRHAPPEAVAQLSPLLQQQLAVYPANLTLKNMAYFLTAPTLCYQTNYPRSSRRRKRWLVRRILEAVVCVALLAILIEQYIMPAAFNSLEPLKGLEVGRVLERVLKLSIPVLYFWLVMFYMFFHLWMNILGELLRFGDREFYRDWWNARNIEEYWRLWNMPVHQWFVRHVYFPCLHLTKSREASVFVVFALSAVFHELVIGVPMNLLRGWAFWGIMSQLPLIPLTKWMNKYLKNEQAGNIVFWLVFCIFGQPLCILLYVHDYLLTKQSVTAAVTAVVTKVATNATTGADEL